MPMHNAIPSQGADVQPYKNNGKELDLMHGLNTYDHGARQNDPILCRWDRMDPLCDGFKVMIVIAILQPNILL